jgi:hypothetical protein
MRAAFLWAACLIVLLPLAAMADPCGCSRETGCSTACAPCFCCAQAPSALSSRQPLAQQGPSVGRAEAPPAARPSSRDPRDVFHVPKTSLI